MNNSCTIAGQLLLCSMMKLNEDTITYRQCSVEGCDRKHHAKGFCGKHHKRLWTHGDPLFTKVNMDHQGGCNEESCAEPYYANGKCRYHYHKQYTKQNPEVYFKSNKEYRGRNPDKRKAHGVIANAIRRGKMKRMPCEECGSEKSEAHHDDYSQPLNVRWLCRNHHLAFHLSQSAG